MTNLPATNSQADVIERVMIEGDLSALTAEQRATYYMRVCTSLGLNPLTKPFSYLRLNGKLVLYALKDCTEQLRKINGVSINSLTDSVVEGVFLVKAQARDKSGREDTATGAVAIEGLKGEAKANAMMKAETKAKRRVTLSICGLGILDETEVETIPDAVIVRNDAATAKVQEARQKLEDMGFKKGDMVPRLPIEGEKVLAEAEPAATETHANGAPTLEDAYAAWQSAWKLATKVGAQDKALFATTGDNVSTIVDRTLALKDAIKARTPQAGR